MQVYTAGSIWIFICSPDDKLREAEHQSRLLIYNWQRDSFELCSKFSTGLGCGACSSICWVSVHHLYATHSASKIMFLSLIKAAALQGSWYWNSKGKETPLWKELWGSSLLFFHAGMECYPRLLTLFPVTNMLLKFNLISIPAFSILTVLILKLWAESHLSYNKTSSFPLN